MKKYLIAIFCFCSLFTISCASKNAPAETEENKFDAPVAENEDFSKSDDYGENNLPTEQAENSFADSLSENNESGDFNFENSDEFLQQENQNEKPEAEIILQSEIDFPLEYEKKSDIQNGENLEEIQEPDVITLEPIQIPIPDENQTESKDEEQTDEKSEIFENDQNGENQNYSGEDDLIFSDEQNEYEERPFFAEEDENAPIDVTADDSLDFAEKSTASESNEKSEKIIPSRSVVLKRQEYVDISYPGSGWIYMGITDGSKDLSYFGRKLGAQDTNFTLQAKNEGVKILHFTKNDSLTNEYLNDYVEVKILSEKGSNKTRVQAPPYKTPPTKKAQKIINAGGAENFQSENILPAETKNENSKNSDENSNQNKNEKSDLKTNQSDRKNGELSLNQSDLLEKIPDKNSTADSVSNSLSALDFQESQKIANLSPEKSENENFDLKTLLQEAQILYNEKEYARALEKIGVFLSQSAKNADEALFLQGQCYEAKSDAQDIKAAINSYSALTKNYPASKFWDKSNKRIIYLKRFYLEAR